MESEQLLAQRKVLQNQVFSGSKRTRTPAEQVTNYQSHHEILVDDLKSADRQVIDSAGLQSFGEAQQLLQLCVLGFGLLGDGDVGVRMFPQHQEILIGGPSFGLVSRQCIGPAQLQVRQCTYGISDHDSAMAENFLELDGSFPALVCGQVG